eukprot:TRINITY_DN2740_c0_g1_i1.p1 TRINITY_DN2740_c0_g1~~TRINITY_DN2740_c0_g1_i1.p1  ORF type:complete len:555 (+),score=155.37 TRINITY_DN2740_c0_g1_i1:48-1712(+)
MEGKETIKICVIGAGVAGLATAYKLINTFKTIKKIEKLKMNEGKKIKENLAEQSYQLKKLTKLEQSKIVELSKYNLEIKVVDGRDRIGGRILTYRDEKLLLDLGANWIHGVHQDNPIYELLVRKLQAPLIFTSKSESILYDHDLYLYKLYDDMGNRISDPVMIRAHARFERLIEELNELRLSYDGDISLKDAIDVILTQNESLSNFKDSTEFKISNWFLQRLEGWFATDIRELSLQYYDNEESISGGHALVGCGYDTIVNELARAIKINKENDLLLCEKAINIDYSDKDKLIVKTKKTNPKSVYSVYPPDKNNDNIIKVENDENETNEYEADYVVCAVPIGVLKKKSINFEPPLPGWKQCAIISSGFGVENKIILHFEEQFWPDVNFIGGISTVISQCSYFLNISRHLKQPVLVYMVSGNVAVDLETKSDEENVQHVLDHLKTMFPSIQLPRLIKAVITRWGSDPYSRGAYTFDTIGTSSTCAQYIQRPISNNKLLFCGEGVHPRFPGTVHGAYSSGIRAAENILISLVKKASPKPTKTNNTSLEEKGKPKSRL